MTRIVIVDPQPAVRAGLMLLLRDEPGLQPVGSASGPSDALQLIARERADVVVLDHRLRDGDGIALCQRLKAVDDLPRVIFYSALPNEELELLVRVAGGDGLVDKSAPPIDLYDAIRTVAAGGSALPPIKPEQVEAAAQRVDPDDLALFAMLMDRTPAAEVAETLHIADTRVAQRTERVLGRLRARRSPAVVSR